MDDKELREKLDRELLGRLMNLESLAWNHQYDWSKKDKVIRKHLLYIQKDILALLQPKIEEARLQGYATGCDATTKGFSHAVEEARRQEKEGILNMVRVDYPDEAEIIRQVLEESREKIRKQAIKSGE